MTSSRWRAVKVTDPSHAVKRDPQGNFIVESMVQMVIFQKASPYTTREQVLVYKSEAGWTAQLTGSEGKEVTDRLPQERWEDLFSQVQAVVAMTGDISKVPLQEIF
jgi:hypothetical protein